MDREVVLGQVSDTWLAASQQVALLEPLYTLDEETGLWVEIERVEEKFPNRGRVTWIKPAEEAVVGSLWTFTFDIQPSFDVREPKHDRYRIDWDSPPEPLREVLDLQTEDADAAFKKVNQGLTLRFTPSRNPYIALDRKTWAGPLKLVLRQGRWMLDDHQRKTLIPRVSALANTDIVSLSVDGRKRKFLRHDAPSPIMDGELDWAPNQLVIQRVLIAARKNPEISQAFNLTRATIQQVIVAMQRGDDSVTEQQISRARMYLADVERIESDISAFESELLALPPVAARIAAAEREGRSLAQQQAEAEALAQARANLDLARNEHAQLTDRLDELRRAVEAAESRVQDAAREAQAAVDTEVRRRDAEVRALDAQIAERRGQLDAQLTLADAALTERIAELIARPAEALAQVAIIRAAVGSKPPSSNAPSAVVAGATARVLQPPASVLYDDEDPVEDQGKMMAALRQTLTTMGIVPSTGIAIHSALVAGMVPLLSGIGALDALEQYARAVAGGRVLWVSVPPTALEPADLLGRVDPRTGRFAPHQSGLLDLLIFAAQQEQHDRLFLVALDGVNRSAVDAYLQPLLACYRASWCVEERRWLSLAHPASLSNDDPYSPAVSLPWPSNVLLAGVLSDGAATLPLPPSLWVDALLVEIGLADVQQAAAPRRRRRASAASLRDWVSWREIAREEMQAGLEALSDLTLDSARVAAPIARSFARVYSALRVWTKDEDALRMAVRCSIAPYAAATGQIDELAHALDAAEIGVGQQDLLLAQRVTA